MVAVGLKTLAVHYGLRRNVRYDALANNIERMVP